MFWILSLGIIGIIVWPCILVDHQKTHLALESIQHGLFCGERRNSFALLVKGLRGNIRAVWPSNCPPFNSRFAERIEIFEWSEDRSLLKVIRKIDDSTEPIIKHDKEGIAVFVLNQFYVVEIPHKSHQSNGAIFLISFPAWARFQSSSNSATFRSIYSRMSLMAVRDFGLPRIMFPLRSKTALSS